MRPPLRMGDDPKAFAAVVGEAVRRARQSLGWTQAQLAEFAGFSPNYIARLERGELGPSLFVANQLCARSGIEVDDLLGASSTHRSSARRRIG